MKEAIVWVDAEFSGILPEADELLEIAAIVTDVDGNIEGEPYHALFSLPNLSEVISKSNSVVKEMHEKSGLWSDLWLAQSKTAAIIDREIVDWLKCKVEEDTQLYLGGNSIYNDRNFISTNLSEFYSKLSFRSIDATTLSIVFASNTNFPRFNKKSNHRALDDVTDSVLEYQHYLRWMNLSIPRRKKKVM